MKAFRRALLGLAFWLAAVTAVSAEAPRTCWPTEPLPVGVERALDDLLTGFLGQPDGAAPGAILLVRRPGWTYFKATGLADPDAGTPLACTSAFEIGSATKMMTGTVLLQLQEEGRLGLDDPLSRHLPETAARLPHGDRITLLNLATHTSGLFSYTDNAPDGALGIMEGALYDPEMLTARRTPEDLVDFVIDHGAPSFAPGAQGQWTYSNTGYILLGMVIERIEGKPLAEVFRDRIFAPLGLDETFLWNDSPLPAFGLPRAWFRWPEGPETTGWNLSQGWAAGGVISTAGDLADFLDALLTGALFDDAATLSTMQTNVPGRFPVSGYGIGLIDMPGGAWGHGGQTMGFQSDSGHAPETATTVVAWTNSANSPVALAVPLVLGALSELPDSR